MKFLSDFFHWLWLVIKKWVWLLALLPILIDYGSAYIPGFPDIRLSSWQGTLTLATIGILISAFLVHRDVTHRLQLYEFHEPHYELEILAIESKICQGEEVHINCTFRAINETEWIGQLHQIGLSNQQPAPGLGSGRLSATDYQPLDFHISNMLNYPYTIPRAGCDFSLEIYYPIRGPFTSKSEEEWQNAFIEVRLLIGYETQPVGYVEKSIPLRIPVNLGGVLEEARRIQQQRNQNDATTN